MCAWCLTLLTADVAYPNGRPLVPAGLTTFTQDHVPTLDELERAHILQVLEQRLGVRHHAHHFRGR